jgi:hypothetical protein
MDFEVIIIIINGISLVLEPNRLTLQMNDVCVCVCDSATATPVHKHPDPLSVHPAI